MPRWTKAQLDDCYIRQQTARRGDAIAQVYGLVSGAIDKPRPGPEPMGEDAREGVDKVRRIVRVTSFRRVLVDERNLHDKAFIDALVEAGALDDSPGWCKVEVIQSKVDDQVLERTEIIIEDL